MNTPVVDNLLSLGNLSLMKKVSEQNVKPILQADILISSISSAESLQLTLLTEKTQQIDFWFPNYECFMASL